MLIGHLLKVRVKDLHFQWITTADVAVQVIPLPPSIMSQSTAWWSLHNDSVAVTSSFRHQSGNWTTPVKLEIRESIAKLEITINDAILWKVFALWSVMRSDCLGSPFQSRIVPSAQQIYFGGPFCKTQVFWRNIGHAAPFSQICGVRFHTNSKTSLLDLWFAKWVCLLFPDITLICS